MGKENGVNNLGCRCVLIVSDGDEVRLLRSGEANYFWRQVSSFNDSNWERRRETGGKKRRAEFIRGLDFHLWEYYLCESESAWCLSILLQVSVECVCLSHTVYQRLVPECFFHFWTESQKNCRTGVKKGGGVRGQHSTIQQALRLKHT